MVNPEYQTTRPVKVELEGTTYNGTYRVMAGSVIVYFADEIKFAPHGMDRPELVARWLLVAWPPARRVLFLRGTASS